MIRSVNKNESFIIMNSGHHNDQILDVKTNNSHWGFVHYFLQNGLGVRKYTHEQLAV